MQNGFVLNRYVHICGIDKLGEICTCSLSVLGYVLITFITFL